MTLLAKPAMDDPQKLDELTQFHWFTKAAGIEFEGLEITEKPDFIMTLQGRKIGVEITGAYRPKSGTYSPKQVEESQNAFAKKLQAQVDPVLPLEIGLMFEEVPVDKGASDIALNILAPLIEEIAQTMTPHSVRLIVQEADMLRNSTHQKHICPELPAFLQSIQLYNDGHTFTVVTGSRACSPEPFTNDELAERLTDKHKRLKLYQKCDEQWLVIVAGAVPPIYFEDSPPKLSLSTMATEFSDLNVVPPVQSDFDRVYFFKAPGDVVLLTEQA